MNVVQSRVQSISNSVQTLLVQASNTCTALSEQQSIPIPVEPVDLVNQICPVNTTKLDRPINVTVDTEEGCVIKTGQLCTVNPGLTCVTFNVLSFVQVHCQFKKRIFLNLFFLFQDDRILMDFFCYVDSSTSAVANGTAAVRQDSFLNFNSTQSIFEDALTDDPHVVGCWCLSFEVTEPLTCRYFAKYCKYSRSNIDATLSL